MCCSLLSDKMQNISLSLGTLNCQTFKKNHSFYANTCLLIKIILTKTKAL